MDAPLKTPELAQDVPGAFHAAHGYTPSNSERPVESGESSGLVGVGGLIPYYQDELVTLYNGDCQDGIPHVRFDVLLTDPPYFLPINSYVGRRGEGYAKTMLGDMSVLRGYFKMMFKLFRDSMPDTGSLYAFCDAKSYPIFFEAMFPLTAHVRLLIWDKLVSYNGYTWRHQHELIAWGELENTERVPTGDGDILKCRGVLQDDKEHAAQKPVPLLEKIVTKHTGTFCDPYAGSGGTLIAAKMHGRKAIGFEMEEAHCETAARRLSETWVNGKTHQLDFLSGGGGAEPVAKDSDGTTREGYNDKLSDSRRE